MLKNGAHSPQNMGHPVTANARKLKIVKFPVKTPREGRLQKKYKEAGPQEKRKLLHKRHPI